MIASKLLRDALKAEAARATSRVAHAALRALKGFPGHVRDVVEEKQRESA